MANGKPGRPRGPNYEKNLQKRLRHEQRRFSNPVQQKDFPNSPLFQLAKSMMMSPALKGMLERKKQEKPTFTHDEQALVNQGIRLRNPDRPRLEDLRKMSYSNSLIGAIHKIRTDDLGQFARPYRDKEGYDFELYDSERKPNEKEKQLISNAKKWFEYMGDKVEGWHNRDRFHEVFQYMIRDTLSLDTICFYLVKNRRGLVTEVQYLDPATVHPVTEDGYKGDTSIRYVQIVNNEVVATFGPDEIIMRHQNMLSDVRYRDTGLSPAEVSIMEIISVVNALKFNRDRFSNNPPPGFMYVPGAMPQEVLEDLQIQWQNMFSNNENNHRFPILTSDAPDLKWTSLNNMNDIAFEKLMQWVTTFTLAAHGMDQAELGLRLMGSQTLSEGSMDGRIDSAMTRAKKAMLSYFSDVCNDIKETVERFEPLVFVFYGIEKTDEEKELSRDEKLVKNIEYIDEVRARRDLPTVGESMKKLYKLSDEEAEKVKFAGAYVLDSNWSQSGGQMVGGLAGQDDGMGGGGFTEEEPEQGEFDFGEDDWEM